MTRVATAGTSSCATISIAGFKKGQKEINEKYKQDKLVPETQGLTVKKFFDEVVLPTSQPLGHSQELPFTRLMEEINTCALKTKLCLATLNLYQYQGDDKYWPKELAKWGFKLVSKTKNDIGTINYVYMRNPNELCIEEGER